MKYLFLFLFSLSIFSCQTDEDRGRKVYMDYLKKNLKNPESLVIHDEKVTVPEKLNMVFTVDYGAENGFGGMSRTTSVFETIPGTKYLKVDGIVVPEE